jgi:hypothetical protein
MFDLNIERIKTEQPKKIKVANPEDRPNMNNSFFEKENSIDLEANILVQKTIVSGLDKVKMNAEVKE